MNEAITLTSLGQFLGLLTLLGGLWYRVEHRISAGALKAQEKADLVAMKLSLLELTTNEKIHDFKLEVARTYASFSHIEQVEQRLVMAIEKLDKSMQALPGQVATIINMKKVTL